MDVLKDNCSLCCKNEPLLKNTFGPQAIRNTFFNVNKEQFDVASATNAQFCIICTHKLHLSILLKKQYDEMCNRNNNFAPTKCYFCEDKATCLVSLNDNPNNAHDKLNIFLSSVIIQHGYKNLTSCIRCLYNLDVWCEVRNNLYKSMNIPITSVRNEDATNNNVSSSRSALSSTKSPKSRTRTLRKTVQSQKSYWQNYLQKKLKNLKTVDKLIEQGHCNLFPTVIEDDEDKLYNTLPFVEICISSQINKEKILQNKEDILPTIVLSDSDNDRNNVSINGRTPRTRLRKTNITKKSTPQRKPARKIRPRSKQNRFRIKFPMKKFTNLISISDNDDSLKITESLDDSSVENESDQFICKRCDKSFTSKCDYLVHDLKHTQIENVIINVRKDRLCEKLIESGKTQDQSLPPTDVKRLLSKWLGDEAAEVYTDMEENSENEELNVNEKSIEADGKESVDESPKVKKIQVEEMHAENEDETENNTEVDITESCDTEKRKDKRTGHDIDSDAIEILNEKNKSDDERQRSKKNNVSAKKRTDKDSKKENEEKDAETDNEMDNMEAHIIESSDVEMRNEEESGLAKEPSPRKVIKKRKNSDDEIQRSEKNKISDKESTSESSKKGNDEREVQTDNNDNANVKNPDDTLDHASQSGNDKTTRESPRKETNNANPKTSRKCIDFDDDSSNSMEAASAQAISCEDLLNILETNIVAEEHETSTTSTANDEVKKSAAEKTLKRKRESLENDSASKKKKVRFSDKKEVFTPDKPGVVIETVIENDVFSQDDVDEKEEENAIHSEDSEGEHEEKETGEHTETEEEEKSAEDEEKEAEKKEKEGDEEEKEAEDEEKEAEEEEKEAKEVEKETEDEEKEAEEEEKEAEEEEKEAEENEKEAEKEAKEAEAEGENTEKNDTEKEQETEEEENNTEQIKDTDAEEKELKTKKVSENSNQLLECEV